MRAESVSRLKADFEACECHLVEPPLERVCKKRFTLCYKLHRKLAPTSLMSSLAAARIASLAILRRKGPLGNGEHRLFKSRPATLDFALGASMISTGAKG